MNRYPDMGSAALYDALSREVRRARRPPVGGDRLGGADLPAGAGVLRPRRRGRLRLAVLRGLPDRGHRGGRDLGPVPVLGRRPARPRRDGGGGHRPHQGRAGLHAQQPDRPGGHPGRAGRVPGEGARRTCWSSSTRRTSSSCGWTTRSTAWRRTAATTTSWSPAPSPRPTGWPASGSGTPSAPAPIAAALRAVSLPFGVSSVAQAAAVASLERRGRAARAGRGAGRRARPGGGRAAPRWAGTCPSRRATSCGSSSASGPLDFAAAADEAGIVVRPFAGEGARVSIGEPEANDRLVAGRGRDLPVARMRPGRAVQSRPAARRTCSDPVRRQATGSTRTANRAVRPTRHSTPKSSGAGRPRPRRG